jgi:hypothetical protein
VVQVATLAVLRLLDTNIYHMQALGVTPGYVGLGTSTRPDDVSKPFTYRLLDVLLSFLAPQPSLSEAIQDQVAHLLGTGLEVFFPEHAQRVALLRDLLRPWAAAADPPVVAPPEMPQLPAALSESARALLLANVCRGLSSLPLAVPFIPDSLRALPLLPAPSAHGRMTGAYAGQQMSYLNETLLAAPPSSKDARIRVGSFVVRGPDWRWEDQDGGPGSRGQVVSLEDGWAGGGGGKVRVLWSNGNHNVYRWGVTEEGHREGLPGEAAKVVYDVQVEAAGGALDGSIPGASVPRLKLRYPVHVVEQSLVLGDGRSPLTKRVVLQYMKETAPPAWIASIGLEAPEATLVKELTGERVARLYRDFQSQFGELTSEDECSWQAEENERRRFLALQRQLLACMTSTGGGDMASAEAVPVPAAVLHFLAALQMVSFGLIKVPSSLPQQRALDVSRQLDAYRESFTTAESKEFRGESGLSRKWDWLEGAYASPVASDGAAGDGGAGADDPADRPRLTSNRVELLRIDPQRCHSTMMVADTGLTLHQGGDKGWGVALARSGFARGSGVHRWRVRLDRVNRRGHVFIGVARRSVGLNSFLGNDSSGWGYLQIQDLYHAGSRKRAAYGDKINQGSVVEVILDTDEGTMSIGDAEKGTDFGVAFQDLYSGMSVVGPDSLIYPAFSLHHPGDMITILSFEGTVAGDAASSDRVSSTSQGPPVFLGPPPGLLVDYTEMLLQSARRTLAALVPEASSSGNSPSSGDDALRGLGRNPVFGLLLPLALISLNRWQVFSPGFQSLGAGVELLSLIEAVNRRGRNGALGKGELCLLSRLEVFLGVIMARTAATTFSGPLESCSNEQRTLLEKCLLSTYRQGPNGAPAGAGSSSLERKWVRSPLFRQGLSSTPKSQTVPLLGDKSIEQVLEEVTEGEGAFFHLEKWLNTHHRQDPRMARLGGPGITRTVRASLMAMLYHTGYLKATLRLTAALEEACTSGDASRAAAFEARIPPFFLLEAWKKACSVRSWASSSRNQGVSYEVTAACVLARVQLLLDLEAAAEDQPVEWLVDGVISGDEGLAGLLASLGTPSAGEGPALSLTRGPSSIGVSLTSPLERERTSVSERSVARVPSSGVIRAMEKQQGEQLQHVLNFIKEPMTLDLVTLRTLQNVALERAKCRESSLRFLLAMLRSMRGDAVGAKAAAIVHLTAAMRGSLSGLGASALRLEGGAFASQGMAFPFPGPITAEHYLDGVEGCGRKAMAGVQLAFETLYAFLATELLRQDVALQLSLLDAWGIIVRAEDHDLLARVRLFNALQDLLKSAGEDDAVYDQRMAQLVTRATMTLVYLLAMQVAMADGSSTLSDGIDGSEASGPALRLCRTPSGPATLSDSVFRMLYTELRGILTNLAGRAAGEPQAGDLQVILSEITTLLLYVCDTPICQRILSRPNWVALILELIRVGPVSAQQRGLRLLRSLLPGCPPQALEASGESLKMDSGFLVGGDDEEATSKTLVCFLMELVARPYEKGTSTSGGAGMGSPRKGRDSGKKVAPIPVGVVTLSNEALSLLEALLLSRGPWSQVTQALLAQALDAVLVLRNLFADQLDREALEAVYSDSFSEVLRTLRYGIAALCALGGQFNFLCPGGRAELQAAGSRRSTVAVLAVDFAAGTADVSADGPEGFPPQDAAGAAAPRTVALDQLRPLPGQRPAGVDVPKGLIAKVIETVCSWAFLATTIPVVMEGEEPASKEKEPPVEVPGEDSFSIEEVILLISCLKCHALRSLYFLLDDSRVASSLLHLEGMSDSKVFTDLLQLAVYKTPVNGIGDATVYEEYAQLLLLFRHEKFEPPAPAEEEKGSGGDGKGSEGASQGSRPADGGSQGQGGDEGRGDAAGEGRQEGRAQEDVHPLAATLAEMGFPLHWCIRALQATVRRTVRQAAVKDRT